MPLPPVSARMSASFQGSRRYAIRPIPELRAGYTERLAFEHRIDRQLTHQADARRSRYRRRQREGAGRAVDRSQRLLQRHARRVIGLLAGFVGMLIVVRPGAVPLTPGVLADSSQSSVCPWKGTASYHDVVVDGQTNAGAAWYYPDPKPAAAEIKDRLAFWKGVTVES